MSARCLLEKIGIKLLANPAFSLIRTNKLGGEADDPEPPSQPPPPPCPSTGAWPLCPQIEKLKAEQSKQPPTPLLGRKFFGDPTELAAKAAPLLRPGGSERGLEPLARRASDTLSAEVRTRVGYVRQELKPERLQPRIDRLPEVPGRVEPMAQPAAPEEAVETPGAPAVVAAEQVRPRPERQESADRAEELPRRRRPERQESADQSEETARRRRPERQESTEHEVAHSLTLGRYEQMERRRERRERRLERQESSEQEMPIRGDLAKG